MTEIVAFMTTCMGGGERMSAGTMNGNRGRSYRRLHRCKSRWAARNVEALPAMSAPMRWMLSSRWSECGCLYVLENCLTSWLNLKILCLCVTSVCTIYYSVMCFVEWKSRKEQDIRPFLIIEAFFILAKNVWHLSKAYFSLSSAVAVLFWHMPFNFKHTKNAINNHGWYLNVITKI